MDELSLAQEDQKTQCIRFEISHNPVTRLELSLDGDGNVRLEANGTPILAILTSGKIALYSFDEDYKMMLEIDGFIIDDLDCVEQEIIELE